MAQPSSMNMREVLRLAWSMGYPASSIELADRAFCSSHTAFSLAAEADGEADDGGQGVAWGSVDSGDYRGGGGGS